MFSKIVSFALFCLSGLDWRGFDTDIKHQPIERINFARVYCKVTHGIKCTGIISECYKDLPTRHEGYDRVRRVMFDALTCSHREDGLSCRHGVNHHKLTTNL